MKCLFYLILTLSQFFLAGGLASLQKDDNDFLFIGNEKFFFGTVKRGKIVNHVFRLENRCTEKIIISRIKMSPNCKVKSSLPIEIVAAQSYDMEISIDTAGSQGVCKTAIILFCESPCYHEKTLFISGKVLSDIKIFPKILSFNDVFKGAAHKKTLKLSSKKPFVPNIKHIIPSSEYINIVFDLENSSDQKIIIDVFLSSDAPLGFINEEIIITTNEKLDPERRIKVTGKIIGDVRIEPDNLNFGMVNSKSSEKIINVKPYKGNSLNIIKIVSTNGVVTTKLVTIRKGREYMILVKPLEPKNNNFLINDVIEIHTNSDLQPVIEISIAGNFSEDYIGSND